MDFDKLRCGSVHPNHFVSALGIAGLDRFLGQEGVRILAEGYTVGKLDGLQLVDYRRFCDDVDNAFTQKVNDNHLLHYDAISQLRKKIVRGFVGDDGVEQGDV